MARYEVRATPIDPTAKTDTDYWKDPAEPIFYVHDTVRGKPVALTNSYDKADAEAHCARLNAGP